MPRALLLLAALIVGQTGRLMADPPDAALSKPPAPAKPGQPEEAKPEDPKLAVAIRKWVRQLNARRLEAREEAERQLTAMGPRILDRLPDASVSLPAEVASRLARVRARLEVLRAKHAARASIVTLKGRFSLLACFEALEQQSGNRIVDLRDRFGQEITNAEIDVDFNKMPFWRALDDVLARSDTTVYAFPGESAIGIVNRSAGETPRGRYAAYAGAFRLEPVELVARLNLRHQGKGTLRLRYEVAWEPRLQPIMIRQRFADLQVFVNGQQAAVEADPEAVVEAQVRRGTIASEFDLPLHLPPAQSERIDRLLGTLEVLLPSGMHTFRFDQLEDANVQEQHQGTTTVVLDRVRMRDSLCEVRMRVRFAHASGALESHRGWIFNNEAFLETADGERVEPATLETTRQTPKEVGIAYLFAIDDVAGYRFVYKTPVLIQSVPVKYELKDLPLP